MLEKKCQQFIKVMTGQNTSAEWNIDVEQIENIFYN